MALFYVKSGTNGRGVHAGRTFRPGDVTLVFKGRIVGPEDVDDHGRYLQVGGTEFLGPSGEIDDYVNHSCTPNCGLRQSGGRFFLIAIKDIRRSEEITYDYSTSMTGGFWEMICHCGSPNCRRMIRDFKTLPVTIQQEYIRLAIVPAYILEEISRSFGG